MPKGVYKRTPEMKTGKHMLGRKLSDEHRINISKSQKGIMPKNKIYGKKGKDNPKWKGGISRNKHGGNTCCKLRMKVFLRDNFTCQFCGVRGVYLESHHIKSWAKYPDLRFDIENEVTLCLDCHKLTDNYRGRI